MRIRFLAKFRILITGFFSQVASFNPSLQELNRLRNACHTNNRTIYGLTGLNEVFKLQLKVKIIIVYFSLALTFDVFSLQGI